MTTKQLERGNLLEKEIKVITKAIEDLKLWIESNNSKNKERSSNNEYYWLRIGKHKDGSGSGIDLSGAYEFNEKFLNKLAEELKAEKEKLKKEFKEL